MFEFDPDLPVRTRSGFKARIVERNMKGQFPIVAVITPHDGDELSRTYRETGKVYEGEVEHSLDLINIPRKASRWLVMAGLEGERIYTFRTYKSALEHSGTLYDLFAIVKIEVEKGTIYNEYDSQ